MDAVKKRSTANPDQFCVYVDEFQNFSSYDDFETLITGGRKYGIATTIAHQERYGQFAENKGILGATDAAGNKICFQLSVRDAQERAADFSDEPPNETKREPELVITPNPLGFLLEKGHKSPQIRAFVDKYLRRMQYKREDAREDMEGERLKRMRYLDQAGIYTVEERIESLESNDEYIRGAYLDARRGALQRVQDQTGVLLNLFDISKNLRLTMRGLNSFLNAVMEKRISCGEEAFSDFLVSLVRGFSGVAGEYAPVLELYIALCYGEAKTARQVPLEFARAHRFFPRSVAETLVDVEQKRKDKKREFMKKELYFYTREERLKNVQEHVSGWRSKKDGYCYAAAKGVVVDYLYFDRYPQLQEWFRPYCEAKFKTEWKVLAPDVEHLIDQICNEARALCDITKEIAVDGAVIASFAAFLKHYRESAFVVFSLIRVARFSSLWKALIFGKFSTEYPGLNILSLPAIVGKEALEIFLLVRNINEYLSRQGAKEDLLQYFCLKGKPMEEQIRLGWWYGGRDSLYDRLIRTEHYLLCSYPLLQETEERVDVQLLRHECDRRRGWLQENLSQFEMRWWDTLDDGEQLYLLFRACDMAIYGAAVANRTWPQPEIAGLSPGRISWLVSLLASLLTDVRREVKEKGFDVPLGESYSSELIPVPTHLPPRLLDSFEKRALQEPCKEELLKADQKTQKAVATISDFVTFCELLAEPDNHIQVPSGQYTEKQVPARHELDMVNQRVRELLELPKYTAYAKVLQEVDGQQRVWKGKIQTLKRKDITDNFLLQQAAISARGVIYIQSREKPKSREQIARESPRDRKGGGGE